MRCGVLIIFSLLWLVGTVAHAQSPEPARAIPYTALPPGSDTAAPPADWQDKVRAKYKALAAGLDPKATEQQEPLPNAPAAVTTAVPETPAPGLTTIMRQVSKKQSQGTALQSLTIGDSPSRDSPKTR